MRQPCSLLLAVLLSCLADRPAPGAPTTRPQASAVTAGQRAHDDAVQRLIDKVMEVRLTTGQTLRVRLSRTTAGQCGLRKAVVAEHQQSRARPLADGGVEVDAWLPRASVASALREIARQCPPASSEQQLALAPAADPVVVATGRYRDDGRARDDRPGWRHCDARQIALAQAAAAIDLRARLFGRVARLRLSASQTVNDLMHRYPRFREAVRRRINELASGEAVIEPTGLCRQTLTVSRAELIELLARAATESGEHLRADFSRVTDPAFEDPLIVSGFGVAPPVSPSDPTAVGPVDAARPDWADQFITAKATGKAPATIGDEQARRELAAKAARIEATRELWMKIEALPLPQGGTVKTLLAADPKTVEAFSAVDNAIFTTSAPVFGEDGTATVSVGVRLEVVWRIVRELPREQE